METPSEHAQACRPRRSSLTKERRSRSKLREKEEINF